VAGDDKSGKWIKQRVPKELLRNPRAVRDRCPPSATSNGFLFGEWIMNTEQQEWEQGLLCVHHNKKFCEVCGTIVQFAILENRQDTDVSRAQETTWIDFVEMFDSHNVTAEKDSWMFCPWKFFDNNGPRRNENLVGCSMICFDFDDDSSWTIDEAKIVFAKYEYLGYTSFNHQKNGKDRFRIVLPLKAFASGEDIQQRRKAIYAKYEGVDRSSLSRTRAFYIPLCPQERVELAKVWPNSGELFDVFSFSAEVFVPCIGFKPTETTDLERQWMIDSLKQCFIGHEPDWRNIGLAMCAEGFTLEDFTYVSVNGLMNSKSAAECARKWQGIVADTNKNIKISKGHLINVLKKHGFYYSKYLSERRKDIDREIKELQGRTK
jgi:hypothetical protein